MLLDIIKDKVLFVPGRYNYPNNTPSSLYNLAFVTASLYPPLSITKPLLLTPIVKDNSKLGTTTLDSSSDSTRLRSPRKRKPRTPRSLKNNNAKSPNYLNIYEISAAAFYANARDKNNRLFSLTLSKIPSE